MVFFDNMANPKSRNGLALGVENKAVLVVVLASDLKVAIDGPDGVLPEQNIALLFSFAGQGDVIGRFQTEIANLEINDFGNTGTRVVEQEQQGVITKTPKVIERNSIEDGFRLWAGKGRYDTMRDLFGFDGANSLANLLHGGIFHCDKAEEGMNAGQARVACLWFVLSPGFQIIEKCKNGCGINVFEGEAIDLLFDVLAAELK